MFQVTVQAASVVELQSKIKELYKANCIEETIKTAITEVKLVDAVESEMAPEPEVEQKEEAPLPKRGGGRKPKKEVPQEEIVLIASEDDDSEDDEKVYTIEDARNALKMVREIRTVDAAIKILKKFDAKKVSEVPADKYKEFIEACHDRAN